MPGYVRKALTCFQHKPPAKRQDQPYPHIKPNYGAKQQYSQENDNSPALNKAGKKFIGLFLFLARAVDGGLLPALSSLASQQANPTERTMELCQQFLDFMSCQEKAVLTYRASDMVLTIHSDASYLSEPKFCSRAGGHMFMAGHDKIPINNGAVLNISKIIWAVMPSAAEAELGALFINAKTAVSMRQTLTELGHPQPRTPMQTDNAPTKFYQKHSRQWTCISTGYGAVMRKVNSVITGNLEHKIWRITSRSITQPHTTRVYVLPY
jgi:hypothetical protein